jgi:seryl-tRNA synthetase
VADSPVVDTNAAPQEEQPTVDIFVKTAFNLNDGEKVTRYEPGRHKVPRFVAEHWYTKNFLGDPNSPDAPAAPAAAGEAVDERAAVLSQRLNEAEARIAKAESDRDALARERDTLKADRDRLAKELSDLEKDLDDAEKEVKFLTAKLSAAQKAQETPTDAEASAKSTKAK